MQRDTNQNLVWSQTQDSQMITESQKTFNEPNQYTQPEDKEMEAQEQSVQERLKIKLTQEHQQEIIQIFKQN